jgi:hypothetical protein
VMLLAVPSATLMLDARLMTGERFAGIAGLLPLFPPLFPPPPPQADRSAKQSNAARIWATPRSH